MHLHLRPCPLPRAVGRPSFSITAYCGPQETRRGSPKTSREHPPMPRFAANLAYLFVERPFMQRFGAAAAAGFKAVELQMPYDHAPTDVRAELTRHGLTQLGLNTQSRPNGGESGLGAVPGREREFAE